MQKSETDSKLTQEKLSFVSVDLYQPMMFSQQNSTTSKSFIIIFRYITIIWYENLIIFISIQRISIVAVICIIYSFLD